MITDYIGSYALFGVAGETHLRISKDGYFTGAADLIVSENQSFELRLGPLKPHANVSGVYTLRIAAANECGTGLGSQMVPEGARAHLHRDRGTDSGTSPRVTRGAGC